MLIGGSLYTTGCIALWHRRSLSKQPAGVSASAVTTRASRRSCQPHSTLGSRAATIRTAAAPADTAARRAGGRHPGALQVGPLPGQAAGGHPGQADGGAHLGAGVQGAHAGRGGGGHRRRAHRRRVPARGRARRDDQRDLRQRRAPALLSATSSICTGMGSGINVMKLTSLTFGSSAHAPCWSPGVVSQHGALAWGCHHQWQPLHKGRHAVAACAGVHIVPTNQPAHVARFLHRCISKYCTPPTTHRHLVDKVRARRRDVCARNTAPV